MTFRRYHNVIIKSKIKQLKKIGSINTKKNNKGWKQLQKLKAFKKKKFRAYGVRFGHSN